MTNVPFQRTQGGKAAKQLFVEKTICYVEGADDVSFFTPVAHALELKMEPAFGKPNAEDLARKMIAGNLKFIVLMDRDLDHLLGRIMDHARVVYVPSYSIENLLFHTNIVIRAISEYCGSQEAQLGDFDEVDKFIDGFIDVLTSVVAVDLALRLEGLGRALVPPHCDAMLQGQKNLNICPKWHKKFNDSVAAVAIEALAAAKHILAVFQPIEAVRKHLRGHIVFGFVRRAFLLGCRRIIGRSPQMEERALLRIFSDAYWRLMPEDGAQIRDGLNFAKASLAA